MPCPGLARLCSLINPFRPRRGLGSRERHPAQLSRNSWASPRVPAVPSPFLPQGPTVPSLPLPSSPARGYSRLCFLAVEEVTTPSPTHFSRLPQPWPQRASPGPRVLPSVAQRGRAGPGKPPLLT